MSRRIHVRISPAGELTVEALGFQGRGCEAATRALEQALGKPAQRRRKPECWRQEQQQQIGHGGSTP